MKNPFAILSKGPSVLGPAVRVERWYSRRERMWVIVRKDGNDYQIGDSQFAGTRAGADCIEREMLANLSEFDPEVRS